MNLESRTVLVLFLCQWSLKVKYTIGQLSNFKFLTVNVIVHDIKEPPLIDVSADNVTVPENLPVGSVLFTLDVTDPDEGIPGGSTLDSVSGIVKSEFWFLWPRDGCL